MFYLYEYFNVFYVSFSYLVQLSFLLDTFSSNLFMKCIINIQRKVSDETHQP